MVATKRVGTELRCHGLAPWRFTLAAAATANLWTNSSKRETPRGKPVASQKIQCFLIATSVSCHGARPWHPGHRLNPEFDLSCEEFKKAVIGAVDKYLVGFAKEGEIPTAQEIRKFISELQDLDLYLTLACARGDEQAWWQFDRQYRSFTERLAHQLVGRGMDANEVIDSVYVELYGTKAVDGVRQSKFRTYTGRGTLRGWLRTVISHTAVDLYRGRQDEIPLEEWSNSGDEMPEGQGWRTEAHGSETSMLEKVA